MGKTKKINGRFFAQAVLVLFISTLFAGFAYGAEKKWNLQMAMFFPETGARWECVQTFIKEVNTRTNGRVNFRTFTSQSLVPGIEEYDYVSKGLADSSITLDAFAVTHEATLGILNIPTVSGWGKVTPMFKDGLLDKLATRLAKDNIKMLVPWPTSDYAAWVHRGKFHKQLGDFKGSKLYAGSPIVKAIATSLEAIPTYIPVSDVYTSLQTGVLDGGQFSIPWVRDTKYYEAAPYVTLVDSHNEFHAMSYIPLFNLNIWNQFPKDIQQTIEEVAWEIHALSIKSWKRDAEAAANFLKTKTKAHIYEVPYDDFKKWAEVSAGPAWDTFVKNGGDFAAEVKKWVKDWEAKKK